MITQWLMATWHIIALSAPWLLFGFLCAGILHAVLPTGLIKKQLESPGIGSVVKASAIGVPLPLCSCSVIPVGVSLRRQGASKGATASFFVSTPEIGVDSFLLSYVLLGPILALARVFATLTSALSIGVLIDALTNADKDSQPEVSEESDHCCISENSPSTKNPESKPADSQSITNKIRKIFRFAYIEVFDDIAIVLSVGFLAAGFVAVLVPDNLFIDLNLSPIVSMVLMLIIGLPIYVCAISSTPFIAALLLKGLNPGAAIVFLLAGPATNIATMLALLQELGKKGLLIYLSGIFLISLLFGILTDIVFRHVDIHSYLNFNSIAQSHTHSQNLPAIIFTLILCVSLIKKLLNKCVFKRKL